MACTQTANGYQCDPGSVTFSTTTDYDTIQWKFDGTVDPNATTNQVTKTYQAGTYTVEMDKTKAGCNPCTSTKTLTIGAAPPPPTTAPAQAGVSPVAVAAVVGVGVLAYLIMSS